MRDRSASDRDGGGGMRARPSPARSSAAGPELAARLSYLNGAADHARIHTDARADEIARAHDANAVTIGRDIYFAAGAFAPESAEGRARIAHELVHVDQFMRGDLAGRSGLIPQTDPLERAAANAEVGNAPSSAPAAISSPPVGSADAPVLLQPTIDPAEIDTLAAAWSTDTEVDLEGHHRLPDLPELCAYILKYGASVVKLKFGTYARGDVELDYHDVGGTGTLFTHALGELLLDHPQLPDVTDQRMAIEIGDDVVSGAIGRVASGLGFTTNVLSDWKDLYGPALVELPDFHSVFAFGPFTNEIDDAGNLNFSSGDYTFALAGPGGSTHPGTASISLTNGSGSVTANATISVPGLGNGALSLRHLPTGGFVGTARMSVGPFGDARSGHRGFSGSLLATYGRGLLDITGTAEYDGARVSGSATLRVTDATAGWDAVRPHITAAMGAMPPVMTPATGLVIVGSGTMTFEFGDWLRGRAAVTVGPDGHIYSRGEIRPTAIIQLLEPRRWRRKLGPTFGPYSVSIFDALFANVEAGGEAELWFNSSLGANIYRIHLEGAFSTNTAMPWLLKIGGILDIAAMAELEAIVRLWIRGNLIRVLTLVDITATITGTARLNAGLQVEAAIGRRLVTAGDPESAEYFISGDFTAHAALALGLHGSIDFSALGGSWNVWSSDRHEWPVGDMRVRRHMELTFGKTKPINVNNPAHGVGSSSANRLVHDLLDRRVPANAAGDPQADTEGTFDTALTPDTTPAADPDRVDPEPVEEAPLPNLEPHTVVPSPYWVDEWVEFEPDPAADPFEVNCPGGCHNRHPNMRGDQPLMMWRRRLVQPPPYEEIPDVPEHGFAEIDDETQVVEFQMSGVRHKLRLIPAQPRPRLIMESFPDDLKTKLDAEITQQTREGDSEEVTALESVKTEAEAVVEHADQLGLGDQPNVTVAELEPLARHIETVAEQFGETDLVDPAGQPGLPAAAHETFDPASPTPEPDNVLELPWADFQARVLDTTISPVDRLILLERQERYLQGEINEMGEWMRTHPLRDRTRSDVERRRGEMVDHLQWVFQQRRRIRFEQNPNERVKLPCFPAGVLVQTPAGPRPIETLRVGDDVWSADPITGTVVAGYVEGVAVNRAIDLYDVHAAGETISATGSHPFWDECTQGWVAVKDLAIGARLRTVTGDTAAVTAVERRSVPATTTYNLELGPYPTYFVGGGVLVHNGSYSFWHAYPWTVGANDNFKIYIGLNTTDEFKDYVYVGQTKQDIQNREDGHHSEANTKLEEHRQGSRRLSARDLFFFRFKQGMRLTEVTNGLKGEGPRSSKQASYLEHKNWRAERSMRGERFVLNRISPPGDYDELERQIKADTDVTTAGYCR
jgi:hypothetical protein